MFNEIRNQFIKVCQAIAGLARPAGVGVVTPILEGKLAERSILVQLHDHIHQILLERLEHEAPEDGADEEEIASVAMEIQSELAATILKDLRHDARNIIGERRSELADFEKRTFHRWKTAFDLFEIMISMAEELGQLNDVELRAQAQKKQDYKFEALSQLHPRALLVSREILCLLKGGFPDGALARWRSLHELTVTAMFIAKHDQSIALNYLASFSFRSLRAARQYNEHAERANLEPFTAEDIAALEEACDTVEQQIGGRLNKDYDWTRPVLDSPNITFYDIEKSVGMDHWRPRYRWASQHTHAAHRPAERMLGLAEAESPLMLVGPSNSGFTDPLQMAAISLAQMTSTFLLHTENLDRAVYSQIMLQLSDELGPLAWNIDKNIRRDSR
jgi:hypothetical protein